MDQIHVFFFSIHDVLFHFIHDSFCCVAVSYFNSKVCKSFYNPLIQVYFIFIDLILGTLSQFCGWGRQDGHD